MFFIIILKKLKWKTKETYTSVCNANSCSQRDEIPNFVLSLYHSILNCIGIVHKLVCSQLTYVLINYQGVKLAFYIVPQIMFLFVEIVNAMMDWWWSISIVNDALIQHESTCDSHQGSIEYRSAIVASP